MPQPNAVWRLYTPIATAVRRFIRHEAESYHRDELARIRKETDRLESILKNPRSSETDKRVARIDLAGRGYRRNENEQ